MPYPRVEMQFWWIEPMDDDADDDWTPGMTRADIRNGNEVFTEGPVGWGPLTEIACTSIHDGDEIGIMLTVDSHDAQAFVDEVAFAFEALSEYDPSTDSAFVENGGKVTV